MTNIKDNRLIDGIIVKKRIIAEVKQYAEEFTELPSLVSILIGDVPEAAVYVRNQARGAEQSGMPFKQVNWPSDITQDECKASRSAANVLIRLWHKLLRLRNCLGNMTPFVIKSHSR